MDPDEHVRRTLTSLCAAAGVSMPTLTHGGPGAPAVHVERGTRSPGSIVIGPGLLDASQSWREAVLARAVADLASETRRCGVTTGPAVPYRQFVKA